jgi:uncharacterized membrane protein
MALFKATSGLDRAFEIGLLFKGIDGLIETVSGISFLFIKTVYITNVVHSLTAGTLRHNPHDFIATHLVHWANGFTKGTALFAALYLLAHGVVKLVLVVEILREHLWAYPGLEEPTFSFIALTIFDGVIVWLTIIEYGRQRERLSKLHKEREASE